MTNATPTFFDNFSSLSLWNGTSGTWDTNFWYNALNGNGGTLPSNGEQEWYINANDPATSSVTPWTVHNGIMTITAAPASSAIQPLINNYQYTSGELNTYNSFSQTYGYFDMRAELPAGQGLWPAFWMIPENGSWPPEIDTMEMLGNNPSQYWTSAHSGTASAEVNSGQANNVANTSTAYGNFAVSWTPTTLTYYFNGQQVYQIATPSDMNTAMYMELNLAVGGTWPGDVNSTTPFPAQMKVAYVDAYSSDPMGNLPTETFTANNTPGQVLLGAAGNDVFNAGTSSVIMTGDGQTNTYIWNALPTAAAHITDFDPSMDSINLTGLLQSVGYTGSNPFGDGTLSLASDGNNGTDVVYHHNGTSTTIVDLDNVATSAVITSQDFITSGSTSSSSGGGGSSGGSSGGSGSSGSGSSGTTTTGPTLTANDTAGQVLTATAANSTFYAGHNSVVMTGDGGSNTYVFDYQPWNAGQITNFNPASDKIDVSHLLSSTGYTGTNPFSDGTLSLGSDGHGGTDLLYHQTSTSIPITIVDIDNVLPSSLNGGSDFVTGTSGTSTSGSGTSGGGTSTTTPGTTLTANDTAGQLLKATTPNDTFIAGHNSVVMTGDGGSNVYEFDYQPWNAGQITNFNPASDKIDVSHMLSSAGYTGTNPFGDGTLTLNSDGHGGADLVYHTSASSIGITIVDIDSVASSSLNIGSDFVTGVTSSTGTSGGSTGTTTPGVTLTANDTAGQVLTGTAGNDTFYAGHNSVVMTGDGGSDTFVFNYQPWNAGHITDFNPAADKIDVSGLLTSAGYTGSNPFGDGTLSLSSDGHGGTDVLYHHSSTSVPITIVDLNNVASSAVNTSLDFITGSSSSTSRSSGGTTTPTGGVTLTASDTAGQVLTGTAGNDTFYAGHNSVVMTGDGGSDTFVFNYQPWNAGQITDFNPAHDTINVSGLLSSAGYAGTNPFGDGTLSLGSDGNGGTNLFFHQSASSIPIKIVDIDHVSSSGLNLSTNFIFH